FYADLWGSRQGKLERLAVASVKAIRWKKLLPASPRYELVPVNRSKRAEYQRAWSVKELFAPGSGSNGVQTSRDHVVVGFNKETLVQRLESFVDCDKTDQQIRREFFGSKSVGT